MTNVVEQFRSTVEDTPQQTAVVTGEGEELSYRDLWIECGRFAGGLRENDVGSGERIALAVEPSLEALVAFYGALRNGSVVVPLPVTDDPEPIVADADVSGVIASNERLKGDLSATVEYGFRVATQGDAQLAVDFDAFTDTEGLADFWEVIGRRDSDTAVLTYVGEDNRGVRLTNQNVAASSRMVADLVPGDVSTDDTMLAAAPFVEVGGLVSCANLATFAGVTLAFPTATETEAIDPSDLTMVAATPSTLGDLAVVGDASLRTIGILGPVPDDETAAEIADWTDDGWYQTAGAVEACGVSHGSTSEDAPSAGSIGRPLDGIDARIVNDEFTDVPAVEPGESPDEQEVGELIVAGESVMTGYRGESSGSEGVVGRVISPLLGGGDDEEEPQNEARSTVERGGVTWAQTGNQAYHDTEGYHYYVNS